MKSGDFEAVIGLEVHVELSTTTKLFCGCLTKFGGLPNSQVCPVCLGLPGCLPVLNQKAVEYALKVALALNCRITEFNKFYRSHYFYPDLPKNYQISQYESYLGEDGFLDIQIDERTSSVKKTSEQTDKVKRIGIKEMHLEEDVGKLIHTSDFSLIDFNRSGIPLLEIVSYPDINSSSEAYQYLTSLKQIIRYLGVSSCDMEKGILRCDANVSVKKRTALTLGTRIELKNMNSFRSVREALDFEIRRQIRILEEGRNLISETRLWNDEEHKTCSMRTKVEAQHYRCFPDPDLPPFIISSQLKEKIQSQLPESPEKRSQRFIDQLKLSPYDSTVLTQEKELADFFERCLKSYSDAKNLCNWITSALLAEINKRDLSLEELNLEPERFTKLVRLVDEGRLSNLSAKEILGVMLDSKKDPEEITLERDLIQIKDSELLEKLIAEVLQDNKDAASDYLAGKEKALSFLIGEVMKKTKGKADPKMVGQILKKRLEGGKI